jgi:hypothetical protein
MISRQTATPSSGEAAWAASIAIRRPDMRPMNSKHRNKITKTIMAISNVTQQLENRR